jgi:hypothetical protein
MGKLFVPVFTVLISYILFCIVIPRIYLPAENSPATNGENFSSSTLINYWKNMKKNACVCLYVCMRLRSISCRLVTQITHTYGMYLAIF